MDTNKTVTVLAPNGRRQNVKVSPNTTILQIIEEVCKKQGFKPEEYDIKHHKKTLDTSVTIRFSGLPNNAQLELSSATKTRLETVVTIGIQLENGNRLLGDFNPGSSLWEILFQLCPEEANPDSNPVIIYMRREVYGKTSLETTTLRNLGLTGGRAMLRLIHKSPEELHTQANVSAPLPSKPPEEQPYIRKMKIEAQVESTPMEISLPTTNHSDNRDSVSKSPPKSELKHPPNVEKRKQSDIVNKTGAIKKITNYENKTAAINTTRNGSIQFQQPQEELVLEYLGERNALLFSLETAQAVPAQDLPDDFFELTIDDAKKLIRDMKQKRMELENANLLTKTSRKLKESRKQLQQLHRYKKSIIRIHFPDQTVLQGIFNPSDMISAVCDFVREYLEEKSTKFYLYTTPPKNILNYSSRLIEIDCVPNAVLYFGTENPTTNGRYLRSDLLEKFTTASVASLAAMKLRQEATRPISAPQVTDSDDLNDDFATTMSEVNFGAGTSGGNPSYQDYAQRSPKSSDKLPKWFKPAK